MEPLKGNARTKLEAFTSALAPEVRVVPVASVFNIGKAPFLNSAVS